MYNKYIKDLAPRFIRVSAFLSPHASGDQGLGALRSPFAFDYLDTMYHNLLSKIKSLWDRAL